MFAPLIEVQELMKNFSRPWCFCGGWAMDLFFEKETRPHHDVEIGVYREDLPKLREYLKGWSFKKVVAGKLEVWGPEEDLQLPIHELYASLGSKEIEILLQDRQGDAWIYRREPSVTLPLAKVVQSGALGMPYLVPELVLLFKSKTIRDKDQADWEAAKASLSPECKLWLRNAIAVAHGSKHPWIETS